MNWKEMKDFCNSLPESELEKAVMLWREDSVISDITAEQMREDYYAHNENEPEDGCFPQSEAESFIKIAPEDYPNGIADFVKIYDKGHPLLHEVF